MKKNYEIHLYCKMCNKFVESFMAMKEVDSDLVYFTECDECKFYYPLQIDDKPAG